MESFPLIPYICLEHNNVQLNGPKHCILAEQEPFALPENQSLPPFVVEFALFILTNLMCSCFYVRSVMSDTISAYNDVRFAFNPICFVWGLCFINVFIYVYRWCPIRFQYLIMFVSLRRHPTCVTSGEGTTCPYWASQFMSGFWWDSCCLFVLFIWPLYCLLQYWIITG
jgi:hypothetical protein